jgi:hypothetical protein
MLLCGLAAPAMAQTQPWSDRFEAARPPPPPLRRGTDLSRQLAPGGLQLDITSMLEAMPPAAEEAPPPPRRPMFSDGWTCDGFGGRSGAWR